MKHRSNIIQRGGAFQRLLIKKHSIILWLIPIVFLSMTTIVSLIGGLALTEFPGFSYGFRVVSDEFRRQPSVFQFYASHAFGRLYVRVAHESRRALFAP